jgi:hypothetical protein
MGLSRTRGILCFNVVLALLAVTSLTCLAQAAPPEVAAALAAAERRAAETGLSLRERERAMDRAIELRQQLISAAADDHRLPEWLMDQAAGVLSRLARDGSDTAVLFGLPMPGQRSAAEAAGAEAAALLARAQRLLERRGGEGEEDQARSVRIPFFQARAELLLAACAEGGEGNAQARHAAAAHAKIGRLSLSSTTPEAMRRVNLGLALLMRSDDPADAQVALDEFGWVLTRGSELGDPIAPLTRAEAWMGLLRASAALNRSEALLDRYFEALDGPPFVEAQAADPLLVVLATDAATRALHEQALRSKDPHLREQAVEAQLQLLRRPDVAIAPRALRALIYEKLSALAEQGLHEQPQMPLPHAMQVAQAMLLAREPDQRERAVALLRDVCAAPDAVPELMPDALWELAVLLAQPAHADDASRLEAARILTQLADEFPDSMRATEAIGAALAFSRALALERAPDGASATVAYLYALEVATMRFLQLPEIDLWRYEYARLILEEVAQVVGRTTEEAETRRATERLTQALTALKAIGPPAAIGADAQRLTERVHHARLELLWNRFRALRLAGHDSAAAGFAASDIVPAAREAAAWARAGDPVFPQVFQLDLADALLEAGERTARRVFEDSVDTIERTPSLGYLLPRAQLGMARALLAAGDSSPAFALLRAVAEELEPRLEGALRHDEAAHEYFWHAWSLMAEILSERDAPGASLGVRIRRLQALDPELGGPPWRDRILAAQAAAAPP